MKILKIDNPTNIIKIDIDTKNKMELSNFKKRFAIFIREFKDFFKIKKIKVFSTNKGYHIYIFLNIELSQLEAVFLSLWLGSDYQRELLNFKRHLAGSDIQSVLFSKKLTVKENEVYRSGEVEDKDSINLKKQLYNILKKYGD